MKFLLALFLVLAAVQGYAEGKIKVSSQTSLGTNTLFLDPLLVLDSGEEVGLYNVSETATGLCKLLGQDSYVSYYGGWVNKNIVTLTENGSLKAYYPANPSVSIIKSVVCTK